jgi:hypothetical protein
MGSIRWLVLTVRLLVGESLGRRLGARGVEASVGPVVCAERAKPRDGRNSVLEKLDAEVLEMRAKASAIGGI